jgi:membrane protein YdbS with pleckstrin-like domain
MRLSPNTDTVPASVNRYLLPHERQVISVHEHPAVLIGPTFLVLLGLAIAGWLSAVASGNGSAMLVIWICWAILVLWAVVKALDWYVHYFVVTSQRLMLVQGLILRKVNMMPLAKVTDMSFQRSQLGRLLGYGEFIVESAGQDQALSHVRFIPYPEQLYLEVCGLIFKETDKDDGTGTPGPGGGSGGTDRIEEELNRLESLMKQFAVVLSGFMTDLMAAVRNINRDTDENPD